LKRNYINSNFILILTLSYIFVFGCGSEKQPIDFSHKKHIDQGLECDTCHRFYMENINSGRPTVDICAECHGEQITESQEEKKLIEEYIKKGKEISWRRIYYEPQHVYYPHFRHVKIAEIKCEFCHGKVAEMKHGLRKPLKNISMYFCINCHEQRNISTDCITCHK